MALVIELRLKGQREREEKAGYSITIFLISIWTNITRDMLGNTLRSGDGVPLEYFS